MQAVHPDAVDLWLVGQDEIRDPSLLARYRDLLSPEERERHVRFVFERHRHQFLVARALVRAGLSRYADVDPRDWTFENNRYGRPRISGPAGVPPIDFNLSHTEGMIVLIVGRAGREFGVDVEDCERQGQTVEIADRFFSPSEAAALRSLPRERQRRRFFDYWTLKEAYIKARGMGLSLPLDQFSYHLDAPAITISFGPGIPDDPRGWQFAQFAPNARHLVGVAVRRGPGADVAIRVSNTVPLASS